MGFTPAPKGNDFKEPVAVRAEEGREEVDRPVCRPKRDGPLATEEETVVLGSTSWVPETLVPLVLDCTVAREGKLEADWSGFETSINCCRVAAADDAGLFSCCFRT